MNTMASVVWASMFLLLSLAGSLIALAAMIGTPISVDIQSGVLALAALVVGSGIALGLTNGNGAPHSWTDEANDLSARRG